MTAQIVFSRSARSLSGVRGGGLVPAYGHQATRRCRHLLAFRMRRSTICERQACWRLRPGTDHPQMFRRRYYLKVFKAGDAGRRRDHIGHNVTWRAARTSLCGRLTDTVSPPSPRMQRCLQSSAGKIGDRPAQCGGPRG